MNNARQLLEITDHAIKTVSFKVARLEMKKSSCDKQKNWNDTDFLMTATSGDYELFILLFAECSVIHAITQNMKHGVPPREEDIPLYFKEYFNILCGHVVSCYNNANHASARFGVSQFFTRHAKDRPYPKNTPLHELCYQCSDGQIKVAFVNYPLKTS